MKEILDAEFLEEEDLFLAGTGRRFVNWIVDTATIIFLYILFLYLHIVVFFPHETGLMEYGHFIEHVLPIIMWFILKFFLYFISESLFKGKTLGKFLTKTIVVNLDGYQPNFLSILKRSIIRLIPFEGLSLFYIPHCLHDKYSGTCVVEDF